jgi:hypothetical protein
MLKKVRICVILLFSIFGVANAMPLKKVSLNITGFNLNKNENIRDYDIHYGQNDDLIFFSKYDIYSYKVYSPSEKIYSIDLKTGEAKLVYEDILEDHEEYRLLEILITDNIEILRIVKNKARSLNLEFKIINYIDNISTEVLVDTNISHYYLPFFVNGIAHIAYKKNNRFIIKQIFLDYNNSIKVIDYHDSNFLYNSDRYDLLVNSLDELYIVNFSSYKSLYKLDSPNSLQFITNLPQNMNYIYFNYDYSKKLIFTKYDSNSIYSYSLRNQKAKKILSSKDIVLKASYGHNNYLYNLKVTPYGYEYDISTDYDHFLSHSIVMNGPKNEPIVLHYTDGFQPVELMHAPSQRNFVYLNVYLNKDKDKVNLINADKNIKKTIGKVTCDSRMISDPQGSRLTFITNSQYDCINLKIDSSLLPRIDNYTVLHIAGSS